MNNRRTFLRRALAAAITAVAALYVPGRPWVLGVQEVDPQPVFPSGQMLVCRLDDPRSGIVDL